MLLDGLRSILSPPAFEGRGDSITDSPAGSQSLYRLSYPTHIFILVNKININQI